MILEVLTKDGWKVPSDTVKNVYGINYTDASRGLHLVDGLAFRKKMETTCPAKIFNRLVKYVSYFNPNEPLYVTDREQTKVSPMTFKDVQAQCVERSIYLPRDLMVQFVDTEEVNMERLSEAVQKKDTGLSWQNLSTENSERFLRQWQVQYGDLVSPYASNIRDMAIIAVRAGFLSLVERKDGLFRLVLMQERFPMRITDVTKLEYEQDLWNYYENGARLVCVYRLNTGEVFLA